MNSFNHYSLGSCGEWMFDTVAGIGVDPAQPGFSHIVIHPRPGGGITEARGSFDSIHGKISTEWTLRNGKMALHVVIPINTTATVEIPAADAASVREGSLAIAKHPEIKPLPDQQEPAAYLVGSGDYSFTCRVP
jgi:alpha-L-rhamnosidase